MGLYYDVHRLKVAVQDAIGDNELELNRAVELARTVADILQQLAGHIARTVYTAEGFLPDRQGK